MIDLIYCGSIMCGFFAMLKLIGWLYDRKCKRIKATKPQQEPKG